MQIVDQDQFSWYRYYNITLEILAEINKINFSVQITWKCIWTLFNYNLNIFSNILYADLE